MLTPLLIFVAIDLGIYLPLALWVVPSDEEAHSPVSTSTPREEASEGRSLDYKPKSLKRHTRVSHYPTCRAFCTRKSLVLYFSIIVMVFGEIFYVSYLNTEIARNYEVSDALVSFIHTLRSSGLVIATFLMCFFP